MNKATSLRAKLGIHALNGALLAGTMLATPAIAQEALPTGGEVVAGSATIETNGSTMTVNQSSDRLVTNWQGFSIGADNKVIFNQPNSGSIALNRVIGQDPSQILGSLVANGQVFLVNPNGIVIGKGGSVQSGGFVGSTLDITNADFVSGNYRFTGTGGAIVNQGELKGGVVALIAPRVQNEGTITGDTALAAGSDVSLDFNGDGLISVEVNASSLETLVENKGLIQVDGGTVILTARGASDALKGVVNNTGTIEAQSLTSRDGRILLLGDMKYGEVNAGGTLAAPFVETSAARVNIADDLQVKTGGGTWLIDPNDFTVAASGGNITGAALTNNLANGNVDITTLQSGTSGGNGDIFVNDSVTWSSHTLSLDADRNITINAPLHGSGTAGLSLAYAQRSPTGDYYINAPVDLASTGTFTTWKGSLVTHYTIVTSLGTETSSGDGTLQGMRGNLTGNYVLGKNIDATGTASWNAGKGFTPIMEYNSSFSGGTSFQGRFDGLGHAVNNLYINVPSYTFVGLFGLADYVRNVSLENVDITGGSLVGGVVGSTMNDVGQILNVHVSGSVKATNDGVGGIAGANVARISFSTANVAVSGTNTAGGIAGVNQASGIIEQSYSSGTVFANSNAGGIVGSSNGTLRDVYSASSTSGGTYVGGIAGGNFGLIDRGYAVGSVSGNSLSGGLVGRGSDSAGHGTLQNSFWNVTTTGQSGACGENSSGTCSATGLTTAQMKTSTPFTAAGWDFTNIWAIDPAINNGYPYLRATVAASVVAPPPPPPPPPPSLSINDFGSSFSTATAPYQPSIALTGTGLSGVTEIRLAWTDPNGQTGTVTWNAANNFGGGRFVVGAGGTSATISPVLVAAGDPSGTYQWTVTFVSGSQTINKAFGVTYTPVVVPPPPPPPPPPVAFTLTGGIDTFYASGAVPYRETFNLSGTGLNTVTSVTLSWTGPGNSSGNKTLNAGNGFNSGEFVSSASGTSATLKPTLLVAGDVPGIYHWTITFNSGGAPVSRSFIVNYGAAALEAPTVVGSIQPTIGDFVWGVPTGSTLPVQIDMTTAGSSLATGLPITNRENATSQQLQAASSYWEYAILSSNVYRDGRDTPELNGLTKVSDSTSTFGNPDYQIQTNAQSSDAYSSPNEVGFYAETFVRMVDGKIVEVIIVFRGTENSTDWLNGNFTSTQENLARQYASKVSADYAKYPGLKITSTGHSLGGALAKVAADQIGGTAIVFNSSPRGPESSNVIAIQEAGDPLNPLQGSDVIYNFGAGTPKSEHSIFNLAQGLRQLAGR